MNKWNDKERLKLIRDITSQIHKGEFGNNVMSNDFQDALERIMLLTNASDNFLNANENHIKNGWKS